MSFLYNKDVKVVSPTNGFSEIVNTERTPLIERIPIKGTSEIRDITIVTGSGSAVIDEFTELKLSTGNTANSSIILDSADRGRYQAGTLGQIGIGVRFEANTAFRNDEYAIWGYRNDLDGVYFGRDSGGIFTAILRNGVEANKTYSENWNIDPIDGSGPSGMSWSPENGNIYQIEYSWYGYGTVLFSVVDQDPKTKRQVAHPVHSFRPVEKTSINFPNLPITARVYNDSVGNEKIMYVGGRQYSILGKYNPSTRVTSNYVFGKAANTTMLPLMTFRGKNTRADLSIAKTLRGFDLLPTDQNLYVEVRSGTTLGGNTEFIVPQNHANNEVATEVNTGATTATGGNVRWAGMVAVGGNTPSKLAGARNENGLTIEFHENENLTVLVRTVTGTGTVSGVVRIEEEW